MNYPAEAVLGQSRHIKSIYGTCYASNWLAPLAAAADSEWLMINLLFLS